MFSIRPIVKQMEKNHSDNGGQVAAINNRQIQAQPQPTINFSRIRIDNQTIAGRFGWAELKPTQPDQPAPNLMVIPFFYRRFDRYCSIRMLQVKLNEYPLHPDIGKCTSHVSTYPILMTEIGLLNEINSIHCDGQFGFAFSRNERVLNIRDALNWYQFWTECYRMLCTNNSDSTPKKCGFMKFKDTILSFVVVQGAPVIPIIHFQNVSDEVMGKAQVLRGWDLAYLKFCWMVMGFKPNFMSVDNVFVIPLNVIACELKESQPFLFYWPSNEKTSKFLVFEPANLQQEQDIKYTN